MSAGDLLEQVVAQPLLARNLTIALAESCTGGLIAHRLTNIAGSSAYVLGGVVSYSNEAKIALLGVSVDDLGREGAVSAIVARQMASGARRTFGAAVGLSVTGIAGPGGGTPTKPVGLTYLGIETPDGAKVIRRVWEADREGNKAASAQAALELLAAYLAGRLDQVDTGIESA
ncbi:MAG TPA: nicotinamide-nucleotide amidohydrolase family protein [Aggregatilineales bacterium]|nr:nicotinamide-nucleotide amidohydrolase family protein [Anaerolineales bacterium]HRE47971.1 nicotinamide-nucleotide amidohydrolase family protein [Aggregatilineales bacterium]